MKGYELHKTGSRVNELLERHFIVPTLESVPNENTGNWADGEYLVDFRIGELCRVKEDQEWVFYRLVDIVNGLRVWQKANASELPDMSDYYTKEETNTKIEESVASIVIPEDESIKNVTEDEYNAMYDANTLSDKTLYFVSKDGSPVALYIGKVQIAVREEGSKGFAYNFPITF
jgi:hypothetical protein